MIKDKIARRLFFLRLLAGAIVTAPLIAASKVAEAANIAFENVLFLSGAAGATTKRTPAQRWAEILNVKDFGAKGDGSTDDTAAIQAAVTAMYAVPNKSCILFFPPGAYVVSNTIDISNNNGGSNFTSGIIRGSGRQATTITGTINNGFIFSQLDGSNGPEEISNIGLSNASTVIGTGALYLSFSSARVANCSFGGMICVLMPFNIFQASIENCNGGTNSNVSTGHTGTFGIAGYHCNVKGWRTTSAMQAGIQFFGANTAVIEGCGIENCTAAWVAGMATGWASACTVSGTTLTVGGNLGSSFLQFGVGAEIFMQGLTTTADWGKSPVDSNRCVITGLGTGTGGAGTYTINRSATISSPVPCVSRYTSSMSGTHFDSITSEACYYIGFVYGLSGCSFTNCGGSATVTECVDAFQTTTGFTSKVGFYIYGNMGATAFRSCSPSNIVSLAEWYFDPSGSPAHLTFESCTGRKDADNITGTSSSITNGSGGTGTIINVLSLTQGVGIGIGMRIFVGGVQVATISGNHVTDNTLTGTGLTGTYRSDTSLNVTGQAITIKTGDDWIMPTGDSQKTALQFVNCCSANLPAGYVTGLNSLNRTYASLPGNVGSNGNYPVVDGMEYAITDGLAGQCADGTCTTWGTNVTGGGGTLHLQVRYNAATSHWTLTGK